MPDMLEMSSSLSSPSVALPQKVPSPHQKACWCHFTLVAIVDTGELELRISRVYGRVDEGDHKILEQDL